MKSKLLYLMVLSTALLASCGNKVPQATSPPIVENQGHTIRILAANDRYSTPSIYVIEVDGEQYVAVYGCGVFKKE